MQIVDEQSIVNNYK